jgi:hypothetical protein
MVEYYYVIFHICGEEKLRIKRVFKYFIDVFYIFHQDSRMGITTVSGEVRNYDNASHSFTLTVTFYDANNNIIGTANGVVNNIGPNQLKTFEAISTNNLSNSKHYLVDVDTIIN